MSSLLSSLIVFANTINEDRSEDKWNRKGDDEKPYNKFKPVDVVFVLEDEFDEEKAPADKKFAKARPIVVGISSENHYSVKSGIQLGEMIVTGGYRTLSKELYHGALVSFNDIKKDNFE